MKTSLRMSEAEEEDSVKNVGIPEEIEAIDGVESSEEAHNLERPARASGIKKHTKKESDDSRTPLSELKAGSIIEGSVKTIMSYGAFLDIGATSDALLHISHLSDDFVANVDEIVKAGETVSVRILSIDADKNQISVTMRSEKADAGVNRPAGGGGRRARPQRSDGDRAAQNIVIQKLASSAFDSTTFIEGEVVSVLDFGAFVRLDTSQLSEGLEGEVDGLVHISAMSEGKVESVAATVSVGQKIQVRVKSVDAEGGKIALSMIAGDKSFGGGGSRYDDDDDGDDFAGIDMDKAEDDDIYGVSEEEFEEWATQNQRRMLEEQLKRAASTNKTPLDDAPSTKVLYEDYMTSEIGAIDMGIKRVNPRYLSNKKDNLVKMWDKVNKMNTEFPPVSSFPEEAAQREAFEMAFEKALTLARESQTSHPLDVPEGQGLD